MNRDRKQPRSVDNARPLSRQQLQVVWENLRTSFWFVPAVMVLVAFFLAWLAYAGDDWLSAPSQRMLPIVYVSTADNARDVISTLLSSMITVTSLVFSITMVVLTLAASQFGPRLIRSFMSSPQTQFVLGTFVMTSVYCLLVLWSIGSRSSEGQQAFVSVSIAISLALVSLCLLVLFLHFLARSIVSETVIERVGNELDEFLDRYEPLEDTSAQGIWSLPDDFDSQAAFFGFNSHGYIEAIEFERLVELAMSADVVIRLTSGPGDYVVPGTREIAVYPAIRCGDELKAAIQDAILIGSVRTPHQDPEFSIRHLVEIAVRALSPGINDPYTATAVINRLSSLLVRLTGLQLPNGQAKDPAGTIRIAYPGTSYTSIFGASFNQIRQNAADKPIVLIYLIDAVARIADQARTQEQREALLDQLDAIVEESKRGGLAGLDERSISIKADAAYKVLREHTDQGTR